MEKRFECKSCHRQFRADESKEVKCPYCGSDNIDYATSRKNKWFLFILGIIGILLICLCIKKCDKPGIHEAEETNNSEATETTGYGTKQDGIPTLRLKSSSYNEKDDTYDCVFLVEPRPKQKYKITISERGESPIAESTDGNFKNLPYSNSEGTYIVRLLDTEKDSVLCELECMEFGRQINIREPWDAKELEKRINAKENLVDNPYISSDLKIKILNNDPRNTESLDKISKIISSVVKRDGFPVSVKSVKHNNQNQISEVELTLGYPEGWFEIDEEDEF